MSSYIILLNWNGWRDTIECLESAFRLKYPEFRVVVCDNASSDGSIERIKAWAKGELLAECTNPRLSSLCLPPAPKPIPFDELMLGQNEAGTDNHNARLVLIHTGANRGFAGGNNVGLRYALGDPHCEFFWLLNNDTVVAPDALSAMVRLMRLQPEIGLCGSLNLSYHNPDYVQCEGGNRYSRWTGRVRKRPMRSVKNLNCDPIKLDYVNGASMLASRAFLEEVGLMDESYFLYFEELDWAMRARGKFPLGYARESVIYHKEGAAIGSNLDRMKRSRLSERYLSRSRTLFTRRFFPLAVPTVVASVCLAAGHRFLSGDPKRAWTMLTAMASGFLSGERKAGTR